MCLLRWAIFLGKQRERHRAGLLNTTKPFWYVISKHFLVCQHLTFYLLIKIDSFFLNTDLNMNILVYILQQLKQQRDKLKQYQKRIELSLEKDRLLAKKCLQSGRKEYVKIVACNTFIGESIKNSLISVEILIF